MQQHNRLVFLGVALTAMIINMDISIANLALAKIGADFHSSLTTLQWIIIIYLLFGVSLQIFTGRLADLKGKKPVYLFGIALFVISSLLCALAPNSMILIIGRALQGIALAFTLTLGMSIAVSVFPFEKKGSVMGVYAMIAGMSQAFGPVIGGFILQFFSWRGLFLINIPLGLGAFILIFIFFAEHKSGKKDQIDRFGAILLSMGLLLVTLAINEMGRWPLFSFEWLSALLSGVFFLLLFYYHERYHPCPLFDFSLLRDRSFTLISIIRFINAYISFAIIFIIPLFLQNILNKSPLETGMIIFVLAAFCAIVSPIAGKLVDRIKNYSPIIVAILLGLFATLILAFIRINLNWILFFSALAMLGVNKAIILPASISVVTSNKDQEKIGIRMGAFYTITLLGAILGVGITGLLVGHLSYAHITNLYSSFLSHTTIQTATLKHLASGSLPLHQPSKTLNASVYEKLIPLLQQSFITGLRWALWLMVGLSILSLVCAVKLQRLSAHDET